MKRAFSVLAAAIIILSACSHGEGLKISKPEHRGMNGERLTLIDSVINDAIDQKIIPGAVVSVVRDNRVVFLEAYGNSQVVPDTVKMTKETLFDLASVSKCVGTTLSFMQLIEKGLVRLSDRVDRYIPGFVNWTDPETGETDEITIQDLLTHSSGLIPYIGENEYRSRFQVNQPDSLMWYIATQVPRRFKPGTRQMYSCLNFITLQNILQKVTGERLCDYAQKNVFDVLELKHTTYFPLFGEPASNAAAESLAKMCAATEVQADGKPLIAAVHDPIARLGNGGNSGNAGVFSNAMDLSVICAALMNGGAYRGHRILGSETVRKMFEIPIDNDPAVARALGWDTYEMYPGTSGEIFDRTRCVGHTGYTGTSIVMELNTKTAVIILTNRVHPTDDGSLGRLRATIANIVASSIEE
ncbi:MAG: beta-lactamase family protein [Bacteroidales bacterium]|nr:beta-lactamase family protein [Bacteroidales bacterium]